MTTPKLSMMQLAGEANQPGDKDTLIVAPGMGTGVEALWGPAAAMLADRFNVFGWDLPGHATGEPFNAPITMADLAAESAKLTAGLRDQGMINPDGKIYFAGVSIGGQIALQTAYAHGGIFDGVAVICSAAKIGTAEGWQERAELVEKAGTPVLMTNSVKVWFADGFVENHPDRSTSLMHTLQNADRFSYARLCGALGEFDLRDQLAEITTPVLVLNGVEDGVVSEADARQIADTVHNGHAIMIEDVAHQAPIERPEKVAQLLRNHLGGVKNIGHHMPATSQEVYDAGMAVRREVLGNSHVDRAESAKDDTTEDFQNLITRYAWGTIWTRPGLSKKMRSAVTISAMISGGYWDEGAMHIRAALRNGLTRDEIKEILLQTAIYASVPAANIAFKLAQDVFAQVDEDLAAGKEL